MKPLPTCSVHLGVFSSVKSKGPWGQQTWECFCGLGTDSLRCLPHLRTRGVIMATVSVSGSLVCILRWEWCLWQLGGNRAPLKQPKQDGGTSKQGRNVPYLILFVHIFGGTALLIVTCNIVVRKDKLLTLLQKGSLLFQCVKSLCSSAVSNTVDTNLSYLLCFLHIQKILRYSEHEKL